MANLKVKTESKAKPCEICHQTDMFEQDNEVCLRCMKLQPAQLLERKVDLDKDSKELEQMQMALAVGLVVDLLIIGFGVVIEFNTKRTDYIFLALIIGGIVGSYFYSRNGIFSSVLERLKIGSLVGLFIGTWGGVLPTFFFLFTILAIFIPSSEENQEISYLYGFLRLFLMLSYLVLPKVIGGIIGTFIVQKPRLTGSKE